MHRTDEPGHDGFKNATIELAQHQPLRTSGCTRNRPDLFRPEAIAANCFQGAWAGLEYQLMACHLLERMLPDDRLFASRAG